MPRWDADAEGRLLVAAMELFLARGYDQVTVAEIAERAGLTKRSFFRYFPDKREVLFGGSADFERAVLTGVRDAPESMPPLDAVLSALTAAGGTLTSWGEPVRQRQQVVDSASELRERELIKSAALLEGIAEVLRQRGADELAARLTARAGLAVFAAAFERWAASPATPSFRDLMDDSLRRLRAAVG